MRATLSPMRNPLEHHAAAAKAAPVPHLRGFHGVSRPALAPVVQAKLRMAATSDSYEREADRVAEWVLSDPIRAPQPVGLGSTRAPAAPLQRKCTKCSSGESLCPECADEEKLAQVETASPPRIQRYSGRGCDVGMLAPAAVDQVLRSPGRPLEPALQEEMGSRYGHDFSDVRIHCGTVAEQSARDINAQAYTVGRDIVFGAGRYAPSTGFGRRLIAHELTHVVQQSVRGSRAASRESFRGKSPAVPVIQRAPAGSDTATILFDAVGLRLPVDPDAIRGLEDWDSKKHGTPGRATTQNVFYVGKFKLLQICTIGTSGAPQVYVYYTTDTTSGDKYAVGPDILIGFVMMNGGKITAKGTNTDQVPQASKSIDPRKLPPAPDCFRGDPHIYYSTPRLPQYNEKGEPFRVGQYIMDSYLRRLPSGDPAVLYYVAKNTLSQFRQEWVVGPASIELFTEKVINFANIAWLAYPSEPGAMPPDYVIHSVRFVEGTMSGDPERAREGLKAWGAAAKDPMWWLQIATSYGGAATPAPKVTTPNLSVIRGGASRTVSGTAIKPSFVSGSGPGPTVARGSVGSGGRATALAVKPSPQTAPVVAPSPVTVPTPRPRPQGVPGWNPNPARVAPRVNPPPPALTGAALAIANKAGVGATVPKSAPRPDVDTDLDRARRRGRCVYQSIAQQSGRYPCHAAYATSLSGVPREVRVTTESESADFDALDAGGTLYEVKTGYRWVAFTGNEAARQNVITRFYAQATTQLIIAYHCRHPLKWYFNDPYAASFFGAINAPYPQYEQVPLPVEVWYAPFSCDQDSDEH